MSFSKLPGPLMDTDNTLIMVSQLFLAVLAFSIIYNNLLSATSVPTHTPDFSSLSIWTLIFNLTSAAVYEEIISRILLIGLPLFLVHKLLGKTKEPMRNYILGGGFDINKATIFLILFSSFTFALAHAPGWDYWKIIPSFVSGLALGYLFVKKGVFASIILHFSINFLSIPNEIANFPLGIQVLFGLLFLFWIIFGAIYFGYYFVKVFKVIVPNKQTS